MFGWEYLLMASRYAKMEFLLSSINLGPTNEMLIWKFDQKDSKVTSLGHVSTFQDQLNGSLFHPLDHHLVITYGPRFTLKQARS